MRYLLISSLLLLVTFLTAQEATLYGKVVVETDTQALPYANVILYADSTFVKAAVTDEAGAFHLTGLSEGEYELVISALGYVTRRQSLALTSPTLHLRPVALQTNDNMLTEAVVVAQKPIVQVLADKTVFNVDKSIAAAGNSAWELLRKAPGVIVDNSGGVILEGKSGVQFYINGKESPLRGADLQAYLESLQATDVSSIELITQPSSRYDAAGSAGIINIVLKKDETLGTNGSLTGGVTQGKQRRYNSGLTLNHRNKQSNLYGSYGGRYGDNSGFLYLRREQNGTEFDARTETLYNTNSHNLRLGYDLYASPRSTFGIVLSTNQYDGQSASDTRTPIRPMTAATATEVLVANNRSDDESGNYTANANYAFTDTSGVSLNIDLDFGRYASDGYTFQPNRYFNGTETEVLRENITAQQTPVGVDLTALKADYERPFLGGVLAVGAKASLVRTDNNFGFFSSPAGVLTRDESLSNRFRYRENITAAYFNFSRKAGDFSYQIGLRAENTASDGELTSNQAINDNQVQRNYTDFFPSGGLTFKLDRKNQFALNYGRRVSRPNYRSLNPFESKIDELSFRRGNPFLQPQYANTLKLTHTYNYRLNTSVSYTRVTDYFAQVTEAAGDDRNFITTRNVADQRVINLGVSYPFSLTDWASSYLSINAYTSSYEATGEGFVAVTQQTLSLYAQTTFTLPAAISFEVSGWYSSPSVWGGTYRTRSLGSLNLAVQRAFLDDNLSFRVAANDVLFTSPWEGTTRFGELFIDGSGGGDSRNVSLSLTYQFGNGKVKKARNRKSGATEEQGRM